uniref:uncharacterized protein LOC120348292 n=1 Tax=Styela clava TaxID=7725 RepID=UPI00193A6D77|nr:uncharacterized protein LOC120348292 [Styela clava]
MAPCIQLHRFLDIQDKERTHLFTFIIENPHDITGFDVRSREFQFAGHRWYVYTGKSNDYYSFYLRIVNLGKDVKVHTAYSFTVINAVNYQNNYTCHSPTGGRVFCRDDDSLSWGWKEFIRKETLLKPSGGFLYDGNKVLIDLECKNFKTLFEEEIMLPSITNEMPYPVIHTSPFSVGGFAWQIRIFPNGPDNESEGNVALFLHCTTSNHLAKVKTRFLIHGQPSPSVYEHTFPANCISEMPSGVAFPNKGDFMSSLKNNKLLVGVEFIAVYEVNEVHVTLSDTTSCPTVCMTPFEDLTGCPWVLKTLQAIKLKLKLDQNEKTTSGLQEFYHRHIMWNATLIAPGSEDVSLNVPLNNKGALIGYFGENWSDADVIRSEMQIQDLSVSDNPYRTEVHDGYEQYSYITIHINIVSNHLLYKTPAPSPTADRERKLLYCARKDRGNMHTRYQELLQQKKEVENKMMALKQAQQEMPEAPKSTLILSVPQWPAMCFRFLFDLIDKCAERHVSKAWRKSYSGNTGRPYIRPVVQSEAENCKFSIRYREHFSLLVNDARPDPADLATIQREVEELHLELTRFVNNSLPLRLTRIVQAGSIGTGTMCGNRTDVDFILLTPDLPKNGHAAWLPGFVHAITKLMCEAVDEGKLEGFSEFYHNAYTVQFMYNDKIEVDLYWTFDWNSEGAGGYDALYNELLKQHNSENLLWFCSAAAERQKIFIEEQPDQVKDLIKVVKNWRNTVDWIDAKWKPPSYLLALLLVRAYEIACHEVEGSLPSNRTVINSFVNLVLTSKNEKEPNIKLSWGRFYDPGDYSIEYTGTTDGNAASFPLIQDPANPLNNIAERPLSWLPFCKAVEKWAQTLGIMRDEIMSHVHNKRML